MNQMLLIILLFANLSQCTNTKMATLPMVESVELEATYIDTTWTTKVQKSKDDWKKKLSQDQYHITREQGTERPFSSALYDIHDEGIYSCLSCDNPLFNSKTKFNSGTGWPSFYDPYYARSVHVSMDNSGGMVRDEITCARCDAHLGHVFNDGPQPTGLRYCMNGIAMKFVKKENIKSKAAAVKTVFAAGCFWCLEAVFENIKGVLSVTSGYAGGSEQNPTYEMVGGGKTSHAEAVEVTYDSTIIKYSDLVRVFFASQDPTQVNGQGPDHGPQYRSIAFYKNDAEKKIIEDYIKGLTTSGKFKKPIAAQVLPMAKYWLAEDYHQDYVKHHPDNPYVLNESIPRLKRTLAQVKDLVR